MVKGFKLVAMSMILGLCASWSVSWAGGAANKPLVIKQGQADSSNPTKNNIDLH